MIDKKVFAVWSPKSGTGTSFLTAALAKYSAMQGYLTGAIDFNRQYSSLPHLLNIKLDKDKSLKNALFTDNDRDVIVNFHENNREQKYLFVLGLNPSDKVDSLHELQQNHIERLLKISREKFNLLFIDLPTSYIEFTSYIGWFYAEKIVIVIDNDINSLFALKKYLRQFDELNIKKDKLVLIVNKDIGIMDLKDIESITNIKPVGFIPFSRNVIKDMNEGKTIFDAGGNIKDRVVQRQIKNLHEVLLREDTDEEVVNINRKFLSFLRTRNKKKQGNTEVGVTNE
ncbi:MAG: hypothetical protein N4A68_05595 [Maledivibacter sp.]|jgi:MinD-like ATPase involved in chromosome partitioning or flagellar assembly|nr:hypothetical protein [Maledivibacter sp.]